MSSAEWRPFCIGLNVRKPLLCSAYASNKGNARRCTDMYIFIWWITNIRQYCQSDSNPDKVHLPYNSLASWWRHQMETFSALLVLCAGNSPVSGEFPSQRPEMRSFGVFFDLCLNKRLSKQSCGWWFETPSRSLWHPCNIKMRHFDSIRPIDEKHNTIPHNWFRGSFWDPDIRS